MLLAGCSSGAQEPPAPGAQLDPDLRRRVDSLLAEAKREPTSAVNAAERADVVWAWANALALTGVEIPSDLPFTIAFVRWTRDGGTVELPPPMDLPPEAHVSRLAGYIEELALLESGRQPGRLRFASSAPLRSREWATVEEIFTVGEAPIPTGAAWVLGTAMGGAGGAGRTQHADPAAPNYVTARASRPGVVLEPAMLPWNGVHSNIGMLAPTPGFRVAAGSLEPGDTVTFTIGDRAQGSRGFQVPVPSSDQLLFPIYVDRDGSGHFFALEWPGLVVLGAPEVAAVRVLAPSVVAPGEPFAITVRSEDDAMNRASGEIPAYRILIGDAVVGTLPRAGPAVSRVEGLRIADTGAHRVTVRSADGRLAATSNPVWVTPAPATRILWGDTHGHTGMAEGRGSARGYFTYATEDARLDFVTLSEHDLWLDDGEWRTLQRLVREFDDPGRFAAVLGYEWTAFPDHGGHHNVFFRDPGSARVGVQEAGTVPELYRGLHRRYAPEDVLIIPHAHLAGDWRQNDAELQRLVELYSAHGSFEWYANAFLRNGFELGFVGASDTHNAKPGLSPPVGATSQPGGLAAVLAPEATTDAVFAALRDLRVYATSGQRIVLDATLNGYAMGTRQPATRRRELRCRVLGTSPIDRIDVVRGGSVIHSRSYLSAPLTGHALVQVAFSSSSEVFGPEPDNPRGHRPWRGTLTVEGARIVGVRRSGLDNPGRDSVALDPDAPQRVRFGLFTRGNTDSFLVELDGAGPSSALHFQIQAGREAGTVSRLRPAAALEAVDVVLRLGDLEDGRLEHPLPQGRHVDAISLQLIDRAAVLDRELEYIDLDPVDDDYYYVRVTQLDGGRAWSSPWWVGPARRSAGARSQGPE